MFETVVLVIFDQIVSMDKLSTGSMSLAFYGCSKKRSSCFDML